MSSPDKMIIEVGGMSCVRCSTAVENALKRVDGVLDATVTFTSGRAEVVIAPGAVTRKKLMKAISSAGYQPIEDRDTYQKRERRQHLLLFLFSAVLSFPFAVMMILMFAAPEAPLTHLLHNGWLQFALATPVQLVAGAHFYKAAFASLRNRSPGMDLLVAMGTTAAWGYSTYVLFSGGSQFYFEGAAMVITLILLGRMLESRAREKTSAAIAMLLKLKPHTVTVFRDGKWVQLDGSAVQPGDRLLIKPGEAVPTDGRVDKGHSFADESLITGESMPVSKNPGDPLTGGTVNGTGSLEMIATAVGEQTVLSGIIRMVEAAQSSKAPVQKLADKIASVFVPSVAVAAVITFVGWLIAGPSVAVAIENAVAVLVIACPCSLGLATPTALMVGMGRGAGMGILLKNAEALENACRLDTVLLDKTGTITEGKPTVTDIRVLGEWEEQRALQLAASLESYSEHPLARAVTESYAGERLPVEDFAALPGQGVSGRVDNSNVKIGTAIFTDAMQADADADEWRQAGKTVLFLSVDNALAAMLAVADPIRPESAASIGELHRLGLKTVMLTGDRKETAQAIATLSGVDDVIAEVLPDQKAEAVKRYREKGAVVGMAGDGVNDAPALAEATVGFAMGSGSDIAMESGDVVLVGGGIAALPRAIRLSRATMRKIKQNLFWAFFYNTVGIPLAALGFLSPIIAGAAMAFSSVSVVTNSLLLRRSKL